MSSKKAKVAGDDSFGEAIRQRRKELGLSQEDVAYKVGIEQTKLSKIERGADRPKDELAFRIAELLKLDITAIRSASYGAGRSSLPDSAGGSAASGR